MIKIKSSVIIMTICLLFSGCKSEKEQVKEQIKQMMACSISLQLNKMECKKKPFTLTDNKYTMLVYVDSAECTPCALNKLRFWNPIIEEAKKKQYDVDFLFILAPKPTEIEDINLELEVTDLQSSIYIDTNYTFKKINKFLPVEKKYHSFLIDQNGNIIFVGNPIEYADIKNVYQRVVGQN